MKRTLLYLLATAILLCLSASHIATFCRHNKAERMQWRQTVAETFRRALLVEVERRSEIPIYCFEKSSSGYTTLKEEIPDSVTMVTTSGHRVTLPFPKERYAYSLIKGGAENSTLTYLLDRYPISIDSLQQTWDSLLQRKQIDVSTSIRYTLTDVSGRTDTLYSRPSLFVQPVDSTLMWYMGYRCERQFVGCAAIPDFVTRPLHLLSLLAKLGLEALLLLFVWHYYDSATGDTRLMHQACRLAALSLLITCGTCCLLWLVGGYRLQAVRQQAIQLLRESVVPVIEHASSSQTSVRISGQTDFSQNKSRSLQTEEGSITASCDSTKERQLLLPDADLTSSLLYLHFAEKFPLSAVYDRWHHSLNATHPSLRCALSLTATRRDSTSVVRVGDADLFCSTNQIGQYYLDRLYLLQLTPFVYIPRMSCIKWYDYAWICSAALILLAWLSVRIRCRREDASPNDSRSSSAWTGEAAVNSFGSYHYDVQRQLLLFQSTERPCALQTYRLMIAFISAPEHFLTNDEIDKTCGWASDDIGIDNRRRQAISQLRKFLATDNEAELISIRSRKGYQLQLLRAKGTTKEV